MKLADIRRGMDSLNGCFIPYEDKHPRNTLCTTLTLILPLPQASDPIMLILNPLIVFALTIPSVFAQDPHNLTTIVGTWSSGSQAVVTGAVSFIIHLSCSKRVFNSSVCLCRTSPILKTWLSPRPRYSQNNMALRIYTDISKDHWRIIFIVSSRPLMWSVMFILLAIQPVQMICTTRLHDTDSWQMVRPSIQSRMFIPHNVAQRRTQPA